MKRLLLATAILLPAFALSACDNGFGYGGTSVGVGYAGSPYAYDAYYDGFYGPIYDGYWGNDQTSTIAAATGSAASTAAIRVTSTASARAARISARCTAASPRSAECARHTSAVGRPVAAGLAAGGTRAVAGMRVVVGMRVADTGRINADSRSGDGL